MLPVVLDDVEDFGLVVGLVVDVSSEGGHSHDQQVNLGIKVSPLGKEEEGSVDCSVLSPKAG